SQQPQPGDPGCPCRSPGTYEAEQRLGAEDSSPCRTTRLGPLVSSQAPLSRCSTSAERTSSSPPRAELALQSVAQQASRLAPPSRTSPDPDACRRSRTLAASQGQRGTSAAICPEPAPPVGILTRSRPGTPQRGRTDPRRSRRSG